MVALRWPATAAVATDEEEGENYHQGQPQDHSQADGVEDTSFMSGLDGFPDRVEEGTVSIHGAGLAWGQRIPIISQALGFPEHSASHWEFIFLSASHLGMLPEAPEKSKMDNSRDMQ